MTSMSILKELKKEANPARAKHSLRFFKTGKGQYGEGDIFLGLSNPVTQSIAKKNTDATIDEIEELLDSPLHEARLCALYILVNQYKKADEVLKKKLMKFYLKKKNRINNWDLVDCSAPRILGQYCFDNDDTSVMKKLLHSKILWDRRIAMLSTFPFIKNDQSEVVFQYAQALLNDEEDLMHKAVGWMLRETCKHSDKPLLQFIAKHGKKMPRTMLRYAIEKFPPKTRKEILLKTRV